MVALVALLHLVVASPPPSLPEWSEPSCPAEGLDSDGDGLTDACEFSLLEAFAPALVVSEAACNWSGGAGRLEGGYLVGAQPVSRGVRLAYLPAYLEDCGWSGPKCLLRWRGGCDPHRGDSEAVFIDVEQGHDGGPWAPSRVFLSAHCFGGSDGRCRWFTAGDLEWVGRAVVVWVAEGKNANYPSKSACDSGHWHFDTCDRNGRAYRFPVLSKLQDIGSAESPFPHRGGDRACVDLEPPGPASSGGKECLWTGERFRGWSLGGGEGATGYREYLGAIAGFIPGGDD